MYSPPTIHDVIDRAVWQVSNEQIRSVLRYSQKRANVNNFKKALAEELEEEFWRLIRDETWERDFVFKRMDFQIMRLFENAYRVKTPFSEVDFDILNMHHPIYGNWSMRTTLRRLEPVIGTTLYVDHGWKHVGLCYFSGKKPTLRTITLSELTGDHKVRRMMEFSRRLKAPVGIGQIVMEDYTPRAGKLTGTKTMLIMGMVVQYAAANGIPIHLIHNNVWRALNSRRIASRWGRDLDLPTPDTLNGDHEYDALKMALAVEYKKHSFWRQKNNG